MEILEISGLQTRQGNWTDVHQLPTPVIARATSPQRPEGRERLVQTLLLLNHVIVGIQALVLVPQVLVDSLLPEFRPLEPIFIGLHSWVCTLLAEFSR